MTGKMRVDENGHKWFDVLVMGVEDIHQVLPDNKADIDRLEDNELSHICEKMGESLCESGLYWNILQGITEEFLAHKGIQGQIK